MIVTSVFRQMFREWLIATPLFAAKQHNSHFCNDFQIGVAI